VATALITSGQTDLMAVERCDQCGYDADDWSDSSAITAIEGLPARWHEALADLASGDLHRRPIRSMWSIAEYADHVREALFGMRFLLDTTLTTPGADLGMSLVHDATHHLGDVAHLRAAL
jgi:hypothetical protein